MTYDVEFWENECRSDEFAQAVRAGNWCEAEDVRSK